MQRRSTIRLSADDIKEGYALACQTVVQGDATVFIPPQEQIERRPRAGERRVAEIALPFPYDWRRDQSTHKYFLDIPPPSLDDNTDDLSRLKRELRRQYNVDECTVSLPTLKKLAGTLREANWRVTAVLEMDTWLNPNGPPRLVDILPGDETAASWGLAVDIGTTSNVVYLVDLLSGKVVDWDLDYNGQIARGEDIISRIIYASKGEGLEELQRLVVRTINRLLKRLANRQGISTSQIYKMTVAGNSTMMHLFLGLPPESIRLEPYITTTNYPLPVTAGELGIDINPQATIDCLPGVGSYVGGDITAGVLSSGLYEAEKLTLFIDVGTNGEVVLGNADWFISCACSAGPAFEGSGVEYGMRATEGAIEDVWINSLTLEPTYRVMGDEPPRGICGSGLISLLGELFITGTIDKSGNIRLDLDSPRVRQGEHGGEYVLASAEETDMGEDIVITEVDIANLLRAKAAIYAGFSVLTESLDLDLSMVEEFYIAGAFGQHINVEKAIQIGLLPDMPWDRFRFLGNTSVRGAYMALLSRDMRRRVTEIARKMTYLELSANNAFFNAFMSALFLPHTNIEDFPSVMKLLGQQTTTRR